MCTVFLSADTRRIEVTTAKLCRVDLELTQESFMRTNAVVVEKKKHVQPKMLNVITTSEKVTIAHYASSRKILHHLKTTSKTILSVTLRF